jgi:hypothetical protein
MSRFSSNYYILKVKEEKTAGPIGQALSVVYT